MKKYDVVEAITNGLLFILILEVLSVNRRWNKLLSSSSLFNHSNRESFLKYVIDCNNNVFTRGLKTYEKCECNFLKAVALKQKIFCNIPDLMVAVVNEIMLQIFNRY